MESELTGISTWESEFIEEPAEIESDLPPEYCHYKDEGCELAACCLDCPFPQCIYDEPRGRQRLLKTMRNGEIARLFSDGNKEVKELASMFGLSQRTIQRALKSTLLTSASKTENGDREKMMNKGDSVKNE